MNEQRPVPYRVAVPALIRSVVNIGRPLALRTILLEEHVGMRLRFADETSARVYRETVVDRGVTENSGALPVQFRLRFVRGWGHTLFRCESLLNTQCSSASLATFPNCGWPATNTASTGASTSGTARSEPRFMAVASRG